MVQAPQRWGFSLAHHPNADNESGRCAAKIQSRRLCQPHDKAQTFDLS